MQKHIDIYKNAFHHVPIIIPYGSVQYLDQYNKAFDEGLGLRSDSVLMDPGRCNLVHGKAPVVFEYYANYSWFNSDGRKWTDETSNNLIHYVETGTPSYVELDGPRMVQEQRALINKLSNRIGYHFSLRNLVLPQKITAGQSFDTLMRWQNDGVAKLFLPCNVAVALMDASGRIVQEHWPDGCNPKEWKPNDTTAERFSMALRDFPDGEYKLAVGLFMNKEDKEPTYKIGNKGRTDDGWYVVANNIQKTGGQYQVGENKNENNEIEVMINSFAQKYDTQPVMQNSAVLVPLRSLFEKLGAKVYWDGANGKITAVKGDTCVFLRIGDCAAYINNDLATLSTPPVINNGVAMVPLRFACEAFGAQVDWDAKSEIADVQTWKDDSNAATNELLNNSGFETGDLQGWATYGSGSAEIQNSIVHAGKSAVRVYNRNAASDSLQQDITDVLTKNGPGEYNLQGYLKTNLGSTTGAIKIWIQDDADEHLYSTGDTEINDQVWKNVSSTLELEWQGKIKHAWVYIDVKDNKSELYLDDMSLTKK